MQWNELYCFQKILPLFTRWQMSAVKFAPEKQLDIFLQPDFIKKKRNPKGIASYEIVWNDAHNMFHGLIPQEQIDAYLEEAGNSLECLWSTIEPQELVVQSYPELVDAFLQRTTKGKKKKPLSQNNDQEKPKKKRETQAAGKEKKRAYKKKDVQHPSVKDLLNKAASQQKLDKTPSQDTESSAQTCSPMEMPEDVDHFLNFTAELEAIADDRTVNDSFNSSVLIDRLCHPDYLQRALEEYMAIIESEKKTAALQNLLSQSMTVMDTVESAVEENGVQRRLVLKQDILNASLNNSQLNHSIVRPRKAKRMSFFFEPIDIPPPDDQQYHETDAMDMFECSLMLKDQIVIAPSPCDDESDPNQTVIYDIDF